MKKKDESKVIGGKARAAALSKAKRKEIAKNAAEKRWDIPRAIYEGEIPIGDFKIPCAVLEDGTRLLTQEGFLKAIGRSGKPAAGRGSQVEKLAPFLALNNLKPYVNKELESSTYPLIFRPISGTRAYGYRAELLPEVCEVYLSARDDGNLLRSQLKFAIACDLLMRGLAHVGIVALVDEATGYQDVRSRDALAKILEAFIEKELQPWTKTFPEAFYQEIFRLRGWSYKGLAAGEKPARPGVLGKYTNDLVYDRLAPGINEELQKVNPTIKGRGRKSHHHRWFTPEYGHPKLAAHIEAITALARVSTSWDQFVLLVNKAYPKPNTTLMLDI